jgi:hypothetical protein
VAWWYLLRWRVELLGWLLAFLGCGWPGHDQRM